MKKVKDKQFWDTVRNNDTYRFFIDELMENYEKYCKNPIEELPYSILNRFFKDGTRAEYQELFFARRQRLNTYALLTMIYPENEEYMVGLQDTIWAICNEYSWALPAHMGFSEKIAIYDESNLKNAHNTIDLFAAETGYALSEIKFILNERLDDWVKERISREIDRRIISVYFNSSEYYWETLKENWSAVCAGSVGCTFIYERPDLFPLIKSRIKKAMDVFLSSYNVGGVCEEGVDYWEYGFGFYVAYAQTLYEITDGVENMFDSEHVKNIAQYSNLIFLNDGLPVTFADSNLAKNPISFGLMGQLKAFYGDMIPTFNFENYGTYDFCGRWQRHIRSIVFFDAENLYKCNIKNQTILKSDVGLFLKKSKKYDLVVTAGNNDAPHNHNDLGSFIIRYGNERIFDDLGAGEYTKAYFEDESRYDYFVCGAQGHSVPVIDGKFQIAGSQYKADMSLQDNTLNVDLTNGYDDNNLKGFVRKFEIFDDKVVLRDCFVFVGNGQIKERFVTKLKPEIKNGSIKISKAVLKYDEQKWEVKVSQEKYNNHHREIITAYVLEFVPKINVTQFDMYIELT